MEKAYTIKEIMSLIMDKYHGATHPMEYTYGYLDALAVLRELAEGKTS